MGCVAARVECSGALAAPSKLQPCHMSVDGCCCGRRCELCGLPGHTHAECAEVALSPTERDHSPKRLSKDNRVPLSPFLRKDHEQHRRTASREAARYEEDDAQLDAEPADEPAQLYETSPASSAAPDRGAQVSGPLPLCS